MAERRRTASARLTAVTGAALALALSTATGCWCTVGMWKWAGTPLPRSRAARVVEATGGGERVLISVKGCTDRPDGWYALDIPDGWGERATRASVWGSDVDGIEEPATSLVPVAGEEAGRRGRRLLRLDFRKVVEGWAPPEGRTYGVIRVPGKERYTAAVFGYDAARGRWVEIGRAPLDSGLRMPGRAALAAPATPFTLAPIDVAIGYYLLIAGAVKGELTFEMPAFRSDLPRLMRRLDDPSPARRIRAAKRLRRYGVHGKPAAPALRALLSAGDGSIAVRREAIWTLNALSALDASHLVAMLRSDDAAIRRDGALFLGEMEPPGAAGHLAEALRDADAGVRRDAATAIGRLGGAARGAVPALVARLRDEGEDEGVRAAAARALGRIGPDAREAARPLREAAGDDSSRVRRASERALESIEAGDQE